MCNTETYNPRIARPTHGSRAQSCFVWLDA